MRFRWLLGLAVTGLCLLPASASAASGGGDAPESLAIVVISILCVGAAYLAADFIVDGLQKRFLILSGFEYFFIGMLLGPAIPQIKVISDLTGLMPIIALAAGWVGLLRGMELDLRRLSEVPPGSTRVALVHTVLVATIVGVTCFFLFQSDILNLQSDGLTALCAGVLGCCAITGSISPANLLGKRYEVTGPTIPLLRRAVRLGDLFSIACFGILFCIYHEESRKGALSLTPTEWTVVSISLGVLLGLLFTPFLGGDETPNSRFLALVGLITFAGGASYVLKLSPLLVCLTLGVTLVNTARSGGIIHSTLENTERPMSLVLLVLAGALFRIPPWLPTAILFGVFISARILGSWIASWTASLGTPLRWDLFMGRLSHGEVTVAMVVGFQLVYDSPLVDAVYAALIASVFLHDIIGPRTLRALLVDAGDIRKEINKKAASPAP